MENITLLIDTLKEMPIWFWGIIAVQIISLIVFSKTIGRTDI